MKALLFNTHDIVLLLTISTYVLLIILHIKGRERFTNTHLLLIGFFALNAFSCLHILVFWSEAMRHRAFEIFHFLYLPWGLSNFIVGPLLLFILQSQLKNTLGRYQIWHFAPALLAAIYLYFVCFRFDFETQSRLLLGAQLYNLPGIYFQQFVTISKLLPLVYAGLGFYYLQQVAFKNTENREPLKMFIGGFASLWAWIAATHFIGRHFPATVGDFMGIAGNYFHLGLTGLLVYLKLTTTNSDQPISNETTTIDHNLINTIVEAMEVKKLYLNPYLSLERFADQIKLSPKVVSQIINREFQQNFHEFINCYRIQSAKEMLRDTHMTNISIKEIAQESGFNSKATFNRFFKKLELVTPGEYRDNHTRAV